MRAIVTRKFRDKHTNALHTIGEEIIVTKGRFEEINSSRPYVEEIKKVK